MAKECSSYRIRWEFGLDSLCRTSTIFLKWLGCGRKCYFKIRIIAAFCSLSSCQVILFPGYNCLHPVNVTSRLLIFMGFDPVFLQFFMQQSCRSVESLAENGCCLPGKHHKRISVPLRSLFMPFIWQSRGSWKKQIISSRLILGDLRQFFQIITGR